MACIAFFVGLVLFVRRRRAGVTVAVPVGLMGLGVVRTVLVLVTLVQLAAAFKALGHVRPEDKSTVLAASISEAMNAAAFGVALELPLLGAAWFVDRWLRRRQEQRLPPAAPAPAGSRCAAHADTPATHICSRCGAFMCAGCAQADGIRCSACLTRAPAR